MSKAKAIELLEEILMEADHHKDCPMGRQQGECDCMDRSYYNLTAIRDRIRRYLDPNTIDIVFRETKPNIAKEKYKKIIEFERGEKVPADAEYLSSIDKMWPGLGYRTFDVFEVYDA